MDEYVLGTWESNLAGRLHEFERRCREAAKAERDKTESKFRRYYTEYARWTQTRSDSTETIRRRHAFFAEEMCNLLSPTPKDTTRVLTEFEKKTVFFRDRELCQYCLFHGGNDHKVSWEECEIHHVIQHAHGGASSIDNAVLVHRDCHPKAKQEVEEFLNWWSRRGPIGSSNLESHGKRESKNGGRLFPPPEGTKARFKYKDKLYSGDIRGEKLNINGNRYNSFSETSREITNTSRNGWRDWELLLPDEEDWILDDEWRNRE